MTYFALVCQVGTPSDEALLLSHYIALAECDYSFFFLDWRVGLLVYALLLLPVRVPLVISRNRCSVVLASKLANFIALSIRLKGRGALERHLERTASTVRTLVLVEMLGHGRVSRSVKLAQYIVVHLGDFFRECLTHGVNLLQN